MRPKTFLAKEHDIDHTQIDSEALYVINKLKQAGYTAYLVGGGVRDLLIKRCPKDFDISTSAKPEEIKDIFRRNCLLIGRRFRLAHVRFGNKILEVSTFRSGDNESDLIIRDNTWGSEEEDVIRRDFTINGLFYDPTKHSVIDYVDGWDDIHKGILRTIGDPEIRFKQDPVRMIRLLKFRARFGMEIEEKTKRALLKCKGEITKSSPARILEEIFRMLESGFSTRFFHLMARSGLLQLIFPSLSAFLNTEDGKRAYALLQMADRTNQNNKGKPLNRAILASCLLFPILEKQVDKILLERQENPNLGEIIMLASSLIKDTLTSSFSHFPRRISTTMNSILCAQYRLTPLSGKRHYRNKFLRSKEFPLALAFLKIRALANRKLIDSYTLWRNIYRQAVNQGTKKSRRHPFLQEKAKREEHEQNSNSAP